MPLPRFNAKDGTPCDPSLFCKTCGYAVADCVVTQDWEGCPLCKRKGVQSKLEPRMNYYPKVKR